jgi:hypothetical protein
MGSLSTVLMETWIVGIPSIMLKSDIDYGDHLYKDGLVDLVTKVEKLDFLIKKNLKYSIKKLKKKRDLIWGKNFSFNKKNLLMALDL